MNRGVVIVEDTESHRALLREAGEYAAAVEAELLLLAFLDDDSYRSDLETLESSDRIADVSHDGDAITEAAADEVNGIAEGVLDGLDVEYDIAATAVDEDERIDREVAAGDEYDCGRAFIVGKSRSPTGKTLFGDFAQRVILNFGGYVTTATS